MDPYGGQRYNGEEDVYVKEGLVISMAKWGRREEQDCQKSTCCLIDISLSFSMASLSAADVFQSFRRGQVNLAESSG